MNVLDAEGGRIFATLTRLTLSHDVAADLLQELFLRLQKSDTFFAADNPGAFAWRTALNLATQWRRTRRRNSEPLRDDFVAAGASPLDRLIRDEQLAALLDSLDELSDLARECFVLRFIDGRSYDEIAQQLARTPHQIRGHCHAAVRQLREKLFVEVTKDVVEK
jgi:RNA polymerase sigma-70 factor (ECF subfamily)